MSRPRKLSPEQVEQVAVDRRNGMSWKKLSVKYHCAINTLRNSLSEYSEEFAPIAHTQRSQLIARLTAAEFEIQSIKMKLKEHLNVPL